jgi:non-canonical purine NTP pyrophosphatase (RdgB/HAM1 family)
MSNEKEKVTILTGNSGKLYEFQNIVGKKINIINNPTDVDEIQSIYVSEVIKDKLDRAINIVNGPCLVDDSGLHIYGDMNGFPGALIKFYYKCLGNEGICKKHGGLDATAVTGIGYYDGTNKHYFLGKRKGKIALQPQCGESGWGWDPIFIPEIEGEDNQLSYAEIGDEKKNEISQRRVALNLLLKHLMKCSNQ